MNGVIFLVAVTFILLFTALLIPVALSLGVNEPEFPAGNLAIFMTLGIFVSVLVLAAIAERSRGMTRVQSLFAVVVTWAIVPVAGALPFVVTGAASLPVALFEAYSGMTTTGATVFTDPAELPLPLRFWRSELEWIGGFLTLVCVLHVLAPAGIGGLPRAGGRFVHGERELTAHLDFDHLRLLLVQYSLVTIVMALGLIICGVEAIDAIMLAMMSVSTGGFVPVQGTLNHVLGQPGMLVMALALAIGATSLFWQTYSLRDIREVMRRNREAVWILRIIAMLAAGYALLLYNAAGSSAVLAPLAALNEGFFAAASVISTSGVETRPGVLALMPSLLVLFLVLGSASIFSTAGGVKFYRIAGMFVQSKRELDLLVYPSSVRAVRFFGNGNSGESARMVWTVFVLATVTIAAGAVLLSALGPGFEAGLTAVLALFANAGPVYNALVPLGADPQLWPGFAQFGTWGMAVSVVIMVLGRLEVVVVFSALNIAFWASR